MNFDVHLAPRWLPWRQSAAARRPGRMCIGCDVIVFTSHFFPLPPLRFCTAPPLLFAFPSAVRKSHFRGAKRKRVRIECNGDVQQYVVAKSGEFLRKASFEFTNGHFEIFECFQIIDSVYSLFYTIMLSNTKIFGHCSMKIFIYTKVHP